MKAANRSSPAPKLDKASLFNVLILLPCIVKSVAVSEVQIIRKGEEDEEMGRGIYHRSFDYGRRRVFRRRAGAG
jgi:hypothetical protein